MNAPASGPLSQWIGDDIDKRRAYNRYILCRGFQEGSVVMGQRGAGICIATRPGWRWGLRLIWARLRLLITLSEDGRTLLREVEEMINEHMQSDGLFVQTVAVRQEFQGTGLAGKLLRQVLPTDDSSVFLLSPQASVLSLLDERTDWLHEVTSLREKEEIQLYQINAKMILETIEKQEQ